jgi:hypothetical protein
VANTRLTAALPRLVDDVVARPVLTIARAAEVTGLSYQGASWNVNRLVTAGIVKRATRKTRPITFYAPEVLALLDQDAAPFPAPP